MTGKLRPAIDSRFGTDPYDIFLNHETYAPRKFNVLCKDAVPDGYPFEHGYKEGSVWNRPLRYFSQPRDVGDTVPYKYIKHFSINLRIIGRIEPTNPELLDIFDRKFQNPHRFSNTPLHSVSKNPFIMIKSNEK